MSGSGNLHELPLRHVRCAGSREHPGAAALAFEQLLQLFVIHDLIGCGTWTRNAHTNKASSETAVLSLVRLKSKAASRFTFTFLFGFKMLKNSKSFSTQRKDARRWPSTLTASCVVRSHRVVAFSHALLLIFFCRFGLLVHDCVVFVMLVALATSVIRFGDKTTRFVVKSCCW